MVQMTKSTWLKGFTVSLLGGAALWSMSSDAAAAHRGSGFLINSQGHILTNTHGVMDEARSPHGYWYSFECRDLTVKSRRFEGRVKIIARD